MSPHRVCLLCPRPAIPGGSRCPQHRRGNWDRRASAPADYADPTYLANRRKLLEGKPLCHWCQVRPATTADHLKPASQGGGHELENLVPACEPCNRLRGASLGGRVTKLRRQGRGERKSGGSKESASQSGAGETPPSGGDERRTHGNQEH